MTVPLETPDAVSLSFSSSDKDEIIHPLLDMTLSDWNNYFSNSNPDHCSITECFLYENDCLTLLSDPISVAVTTPWDLTARRDVSAGYTQ
jgi:hypothetical protein